MSCKSRIKRERELRQQSRLRGTRAVACEFTES